MKKIFWLNQLDEAKQNFWSYNYFLIIITSATPFFWLDLFDSLTRTFFSINNSRGIYGLLKVLFDNVFYLWKKSIYLWTEILNKDLSAVNYVQLSRRTIYIVYSSVNVCYKSVIVTVSSCVKNSLSGKTVVFSTTCIKRFNERYVIYANENLRPLNW